MYYITDCDGVSVDIRVLNWNQKNLQITDRLQSHSNTSAVCFASGKIRWDYEKHNVEVQMFPCNLPPLKICKFAVRELDYSAQKHANLAVLLSSTIVQMYLYIYQNRKTTGQGNRFREEHNKLALNVCGDGLECLNQHQKD